MEEELLLKFCSDNNKPSHYDRGINNHMCAHNERCQKWKEK